MTLNILVKTLFDICYCMGNTHMWKEVLKVPAYLCGNDKKKNLTNQHKPLVLKPIY